MKKIINILLIGVLIFSLSIIVVCESESLAFEQEGTTKGTLAVDAKTKASENEMMELMLYSVAFVSISIALIVFGLGIRAMLKKEYFHVLIYFSIAILLIMLSFYIK